MNNVIVEELTSIIHANKAEERGRELCLKLKENLSREQFEYPIRATVNNRVIAKAVVKAYRKDVTARVVSPVQIFISLCCLVYLSVVSDISSLFDLVFR